ncbi:hypothetical protein Dimus_017965 [Dionaea muscipula]
MESGSPPEPESAASSAASAAAVANAVRTAASGDPLTSTQHRYETLNDLTQELSSLQELAVRGSWRSIIDKVSRARSLSLLRYPHEHLLYLTFNALAHVKLRRFSDALRDIDSLDDLDDPSYRYESYPHLYPSSSGSMVPFSLRWLHAQLPSKLGKRPETLDRLYLLLGFVRSRIQIKAEANLDVSVGVWRRREEFVISSIITHHLTQKEFAVCLDLIKDMLGRDMENAVLLSMLGYVQMQYGDLEGAKGSFDKVEGLLSKKRKEEGDEVVELGENGLRNLVSRNKGLLYMVGKDYVSASRVYGECIERDASDVVAINNKALSLMYLRDLSDSIKVLESALERVPTVALNETLVVNLCSMYELAHVNHSDIKRTLSNWIAQVAPDDFDASSTRV